MMQFLIVQLKNFNIVAEFIGLSPDRVTFVKSIADRTLRRRVLETEWVVLSRQRSPSLRLLIAA
jgi:hypothetical protein